MRRLLSFCWFMLVGSYLYAQVAFNVPVAFNSISAKPQTLHFKNGVKNIPVGGHLQGIQAVSNNHFVITASSGSIAYYLTAELNADNKHGQITGLQQIADRPYKHAGGCQVNENKMIVGVEDNSAKNKADIFMIDFNDAAQQTGKRVIAHRQGKVKRTTAGAVGFTKLPTGQLLVAVGDWDSRNIDFYLSQTGHDELFDSVATFRAPVNKKWPSFQSINLLTDTSGIYLIGFALAGTRNKAYLFRVEFNAGDAKLKLLNERTFTCKNGAGFRYGSGIRVAGNSIAIYSCGRNAGRGVAVNIFK